MVLLKFVILLLVLSLVAFLCEKILRKIANVEKRKGFIYKPVNKRQKTGERIISALFLISLIAYFSIYSTPYIPMFTYLVVLFLYRAFMEWKYQKESKEYIITLSSTVLSALLMYVVIQANILDIIVN